MISVVLIAQQQLFLQLEHLQHFVWPHKSSKYGPVRHSRVAFAASSHVQPRNRFPSQLEELLVSADNFSCPFLDLKSMKESLICFSRRGTKLKDYPDK